MEHHDLFPSTTIEQLRECWLEGRHHVEHGDVARLGELLDAPLRPQEFIPRAAYYCTFSAFKANGDGELAPLHSISADHALQLYERGHTIQCAGAVRGTRSAEWSAELSRQWGIPHVSASVRTIFSPPNAVDAFGWHFDTANVIAVQLSGSKRWQLAPNEDLRFPHRAGHPSQPVRGPLNGLPGFSPRGYGPWSFDTSSFRDATRVELVPGSVLFNPGGQWHRTSSVGAQGSCSVSFLFEPDSWLKLLVRGLVSTLIEDAQWREPALGLTAPGAGRAVATAAFVNRVEGLKALVQELDAAELLQRAHDSHLSRDVDGAGPLRLAPAARAGIEQAVDGQWRLSVVDGDGASTDLEVSAALVPSCRWILDSEHVPFSMSTLVLATSPSPENIEPDWIDRVTALISVLETLGVVDALPPEP